MYRSLPLLFLLLACSGPFALAAQFTGPDESAIRKLVQSYLEARERRDDRALTAVFTLDADQLVSSGEWRKGQASLVQGTLASSARESGKRIVEIETIRFLAKDVAIADGRYSIAGDAAAAAEVRKMWSTFVLKREKGRWKIAAIRNMLPTGRQ